MIERVVENWLTSVNERQYQLPFCQLLASEGETIIYISRHGQREQGKDVITRASQGIRAYQLKQGDLSLADWRKYKGEIDELVTYPPTHPSVRAMKPHKSYLVTNGTVSDPVLDAITSANRAWARCHAGPLTLTDKPALVTRFVRAHGQFLPQDIKEFNRFLELVVGSGKSPFAKAKFATFLEAILPIDKTSDRPRNVQRAITSAVLLTSYVVQGCEHQENHWGAFEAWTMMAAYIGAASSKHGTPQSYWRTSMELCISAARRALESLVSECEKNTRNFVQGSPLSDGYSYAPRITILAGLLGAASLAYRVRRESWEHEDFVRRFLVAYLPKITLWGESAVPYLAVAALAIEYHGEHTLADGLILQLVRAIATTNSTKSRGFPNPYYEPEPALRIAYGLDKTNAEMFTGHSYTLEPLVHYLVSRWIRQNLALVWDKITRVSFAHFDTESDWEFFRWRSDGGKLITTLPKCPQSWKVLVEQSEAPPKRHPAILGQFPELAVYLCLVYPHRFTTDLFKIVDRSTRSAA